MAARPQLQALERKISELPGGEHYIFERIADGAKVGEISAELGVSRRMLYYWRDRNGADHRKGLWAEAMRMQGEAQAERGIEELEGLTEGGKIPTGSEVQLGIGKSKYRQWLAGKRDPETFGDKGLELNFNVGQLHLGAVAEARKLTPPTYDDGDDTPFLEAEVVDEGGETNDTVGIGAIVVVGDADEVESADTVPSVSEEPGGGDNPSGTLPDELADLVGL